MRLTAHLRPLLVCAILFAVAPAALGQDDAALRRKLMAEDFAHYIGQRSPHLNFIAPLVRRHGKGWLILAKHDFYNKYSMSMGSLPQDVAQWMEHRMDTFRELKIVGVGVFGTGPYASGVWVSVK